MEELLQRYIRGDVSEEEKVRITHWLDGNPENMREYMALRKLYDISLWNGKTQQYGKTRRNGKAQFPNREARRPSLRRLSFEILKIAAVLIIGFSGAWQFLHDPADPLRMQTVHVPAGQRAELTLADGTKVWLNSRSTLRFPTQFVSRSRKVELDGEGYFAVIHNENAPFTVQTSRYDIRVLGTEFNVKAYAESRSFETALLKGSVEIGTKNTEHTLRLQPNEVARMQNGKLLTSFIQDYNYFKWKDGLFCFEDETIENLIEKMQLYYDVKIEVRRPSLLPYRYSGKFRIKDGIEHVLRVLQLKHQFTYSKDEDSNVIVIQ